MINAIAFHHLAHGLWKRGVPLLPRLLMLVIFLLYNSSIPCQAVIGKGSYLGYGGIGVVIHRRARIGRNVVIGPQVTIGGRSGSAGVPRIGDNVYLGAGARVLGDIEIGDYVIVGANAVVLHSVASGTVVAGVPARVVRDNLTPEQFRALT